MLHEAQANFEKMGLMGETPSVDWSKMQSYKDTTIEQNTKGIEFLFKKNKVDWLKGWGSIPEAGKVKVGDETHEAKHIVIATGSVPASIPGVEIDEERVVSSTGALLPRRDPGQDGGDRRRRHRPGDGVGLCPPRHRGDGGRVSRHDHPRHGRRGAEAVPEDPGKQGMEFVLGAAVQRVETTDDGCTVTYKLRRTTRKRRSRPISCWSPPAASRSPTGWASPTSASR